MKKILRIVNAITIGSKFKTAVLWFYILSIVIILDAYIGLKPHIQHYFGTVGLFVGKLLAVYYGILIARIGGEYLQDFMNKNIGDLKDEDAE